MRVKLGPSGRELKEVDAESSTAHPESLHGMRGEGLAQRKLTLGQKGVVVKKLTACNGR